MGSLSVIAIIVAIIAGLIAIIGGLIKMVLFYADFFSAIKDFKYLLNKDFNYTYRTHVGREIANFNKDTGMLEKIKVFPIYYLSRKND